MITVRALVGAAATLVAGAAAAAPAVDLDAVQKSPPAFVVSDRSSESVQFVDVGRVVPLQDGTLATHDYVVLKDPRRVNGATWTYGDLVVQYDCLLGTITVRSGLLIGEDFKPVGSLQLPADGKRWVAADDPDVASTYGFPLLCHTGGAPAALVGTARPWQTLAKSFLADLRAR